MSPADSRHDWNRPESIDVLKGLLLRLPGVEGVKAIDRSDEFIIRLHCSEIAGIDALAYAVGCANGRVFVRRAMDAGSRGSEERDSVLCEFCTAKEEEQSNTLVYTVGFYVAIWLYRAKVIDDRILDQLEAMWPVNFQMHRG